MTRMPAGSRDHAAIAAVPIAEPTSLREHELAAYCPDLDEWPDLSRKTLHRHRDNLWLLGGELIRKLHETPGFRRRPIDQLVLAAVDEDGGPLIHHGTKEQQRSFDATCRKLYRFLQERNDSSPSQGSPCGYRG